MDEIHVHKTKKSICAHFAESPCNSEIPVYSHYIQKCHCSPVRLKIYISLRLKNMKKFKIKFKKNLNCQFFINFKKKNVLFTMQYGCCFDAFIFCSWLYNSYLLLSDEITSEFAFKNKKKQ